MLLIALVCVLTALAVWLGIKYVDWMFDYGMSRDWPPGLLICVLLLPFAVGLSITSACWT